MAELYGWIGKILKVDLSSATITTIPTTNYVPKWMGGRALGSRIHWEMVSPQTKAFDPENLLTFMTGPLTGVTDGRTCVGGVSSLYYPVQSYFRSTIGGHAGAELKFAGYDGIILTGKAARPSYLLINDDQVEIRDAHMLWGLDTYATQQNLWERHGEKCKIFVIGPAGENLVRDAAIQTNGANAAGLGGFGAVMGSKNLKAIVIRGSGSVKVADPAKLLELRVLENNSYNRNWGCGAQAGSQIEQEGKVGTARLGYAGCFACQFPCGVSVKWKDGHNVGTDSFKCGEFICDTAELAYTGEYVGRNHYSRIKQQHLYGITGQQSLKCVIQDDENSEYDEPITLLHNGVITEADLGIPYKYGSPEFNREYLRMMTYREGPAGNAMAEGGAILANEFVGTPAAIRDYQLNCMRSGMHGFIPGFVITLYRAPGLLCKCTTNVGGADQRGLYHWLLPSYPWWGSEDLTKVAASLYNWEWEPYTVNAVVNMQDYKAKIDSALRCFFQAGPDEMGRHLRLMQQMYAAVTGSTELDEANEAKWAQSVYLLERSIYNRQGHTRKDDWLFDSVFEKLGETRITPTKLNKALDEFYTVRGMDLDTAIPRRSTLESLGMKDVADDLAGKYSIAVPA